jgi:hypothetical protein
MEENPGARMNLRGIMPTDADLIDYPHNHPCRLLWRQASRHVRDGYFVTVTVNVVEWVSAPAAETPVKVMG